MSKAYDGFKIAAAGIWVSGRKGGIVATRQTSGKWAAVGRQIGTIHGKTLTAVVTAANKR